MRNPMYVSFAVVLVGMSLYLARPAPLIYFETRGINNEFPVLIIGFRDGHAIVYRMTFPEEMSLLAGDGTVVPGESIEVPIMDDLAKITGEFAIDVDRVWETLRRFMTTGSTADLGTWTEL